MDYFVQASSDNFRLAKSKYIMSPADDTHGVIRLPKFSFLLDVFFNLIVPYSGTSTGAITVGIYGNGVAADVDAVLVDSYIDSEAAGMSRMSGGAAAAAEGYHFSTAGGAITITTSIGDSSAEIECQVFALYTVIH